MQKYTFLKLNLKVKRQYFKMWSEEFINQIQIDELLAFVSMYAGSSTSFLHHEPLKDEVTILTKAENFAKNVINSDK